MARLQVLTIPNIDITSDEVVVHGQTVGADGSVEVYGTCGDGTLHPLRYTVCGKAGGSWKLRISCGSDLVYSDDVTLAAGSETFESGPRELKLSPIRPDNPQA